MAGIERWMCDSILKPAKECQGNHRALGRVLPLRKSQSSMQFGRSQFTLSSVPGGPEETKSCGTFVVLVSIEPATFGS